MENKVASDKSGSAGNDNGHNKLLSNGDRDDGFLSVPGGSFVSLWQAQYIRWRYVTFKHFFGENQSLWKVHKKLKREVIHKAAPMDQTDVRKIKELSKICLLSCMIKELKDKKNARSIA